MGSRGSTCDPATGQHDAETKGKSLEQIQQAWCPSPTTLATASWPAVPVTLTGDQYNTPLIGHSPDALDWEHTTTVAELQPAGV